MVAATERTFLKSMFLQEQQPPRLFWLNEGKRQQFEAFKASKSEQGLSKLSDKQRSWKGNHAKLELNISTRSFENQELCCFCSVAYKIKREPHMYTSAWRIQF